MHVLFRFRRSARRRPRDIGISTRKVVRRGCDSHSMTPPWSPMILATSARPRPVPLVLEVTKGSKRCGSRSSGTPGPLSLHAELERQRHPRLRLPGDRQPDARPEGGAEYDLAVGRARRSPRRRSSPGSGRPGSAGRGWRAPAAATDRIPRRYAMWRAKPVCASRFTRSSTAWMLTGSRSIGRSSAKTSMRSTSSTMRSASSQIRRVSARSSSSADRLRAAAPRRGCRRAGS